MLTHEGIDSDRECPIRILGINRKGIKREKEQRENKTIKRLTKRTNTRKGLRKEFVLYKGPHTDDVGRQKLFFLMYWNRCMGMRNDNVLVPI